MTNGKNERAHYSPPWANVCIIGIAGSSGSGKSTLSNAIVNKMNLPWVVILPMVKMQHYECWRVVSDPIT